MAKHLIFIFKRGNSAYEYALVSLLFNGCLIFTLPQVGKLTFLHFLFVAMGLFWSNGLWLLLRKLAPRHPTITFLLSHTLVIFAFVVNAYHYILFSEHLNFGTLQIGINGIITGEAKLGVQNILAYLQQSSYLTLAMWIPLLLLLFVPFGKGETKISRYKLNYYLFIGSMFVLTLFFFIKPEISSADVKKIHYAIPYFSYAEPEDQYNNTLFNLEHLQGTRALEQAQIKRLIEFRETIEHLELQAEHTPNILFLHLESLRADMLSEEIMPRLYHWGQSEGEILEHHYSTSSNTTAGMFGLLHGLEGSYFQSTPILGYFPIPLDILEELGYSIHVYHGKSLSYDSMDRRFFVETMDDNFYGHYFGDTDEDDAGVLNQAFKDFKLSHEDAKSPPRFDYIKLDSTHWNYIYPEEFEKFTPVISDNFEISAYMNMHMKAFREELFNRYKNASFYMDYIVSKFLEDLTKIGYLDNTIVIITGDHGEEFWEHGRFGHVYGLSKEQINVIALVHFPEGLDTQYSTTSHSDIFPTIFSYMDIEPLPDDIFTGKNLYHYDENKDFALSSIGTISRMQKYNEAVMSENLKVDFKLKDNLEIYKITDTDDELLEHYDVQAVRELILKSVAMKQSLARSLEKTSP